MKKNILNQQLPEQENKNRLEKFRDALSENHIDLALITNPQDVRYFSGFTGSDSWLLIGRKKQYLITDFRYVEEAEKSAPLFQTILWKKNQANFAGELIKKHKARKVGYSSLNLTVQYYDNMAKQTQHVNYIAIDALIAKLRSIKSGWEIIQIKNALACAESAFQQAKNNWRAGMTEKEVKLDLETAMLRNGGDAIAFETIVAVAANASLPHAHSGKTKLKKGGLLLVDFGIRINGYNSDLTRTLWLGNIPSRWEKRYKAVLAAQMAAITEIKAGIAGSVPDQAARKVFKKYKWDKLFGHGLGPGVGLAVHEMPRMGKSAINLLETGNIITVEPGLYFPGEGGIRIEDMVAVNDSGCQVLSKLEKNPEDIVI